MTMPAAAFGAVALQSNPVVGSLPGSLLAAPSVDFDFTVVYAAAVFSALIVLLKPLLFDPVLRVFELREQRTEGAKAEARAMQEKAGELLRKYERELERINQVAAEQRDRLRAETVKLEAEIFEEARKATASIVEEGRQRIEREMAVLRRDLSGEADRIARDVATTLLGREAN